MISEEEKTLARMKPFARTPSTRDHANRPNYIDLSLNYNNGPHKSNTAIICTSHRGHLAFLKYALRQYRKTGKFVICSYDPAVFPWDSEEHYQNNTPDIDIYCAAHMWIYKHITYEEPKRNGWFWDVRYAQGIIRNFDNFEYVFTVNGDCIWEKPEGVDELIELMGDNNLMSVTSDHNTIHTCAVLFKREAFMKILDYMAAYHKTSIIGSYSPEKILLEAVTVLGMKEKKVPNQPEEPGEPGNVDHYSRYKQPHTWNDIVGYRNIGAEWITTLIERFDPIEKKFIDFKHFDTIYADCSSHIRKYYDTGDRRYIYKGWQENEDSWYDRVYYPIEHYGKTPIGEGSPEAAEGDILFRKGGTY